MNRSPLLARLLVIAAAVLFSTGGAAIKLSTWSSWQIAGGRSLVATIAILVLLPEARRWRLRYLPVAVCYAATLVLFVSATKLTTAANAIFLQDTAPLFVLLLSPILLKERIRRADLVLMGAVAIGMTLFFAAAEPPRASAPNPLRGKIFAAVAALTWAFTLVGLRWIGSKGKSMSAGMATVAMGNLLASLSALPFAFPAGSAQTGDIAAVLWLGLFQIGLAYLCLTKGIIAVPAIEATTLLLLEPVLNPVWAWLLQGEKPARLAVAGGAVILSSTLANAWWKTRTLV